MVASVSRDLWFSRNELVSWGNAVGLNDKEGFYFIVLRLVG